MHSKPASGEQASWPSRGRSSVAGDLLPAEGEARLLQIHLLEALQGADGWLGQAPVERSTGDAHPRWNAHKLELFHYAWWG